MLFLVFSLVIGKKQLQNTVHQYILSNCDVSKYFIIQILLN